MNKKTFRLDVIRKKSFSLSVFGASITNTFKANIRLALKIVASLSVLFDLKNTNVSLKAIKIAVLKFQTILRPSPSIRLGRIILVAQAKLIARMQKALGLKIVVSAIAKLRTRISIPIGLKISIVAPLLAGQFYTLAEYDPDTLLSMDSVTLGDLEFHAV